MSVDGVWGFVYAGERGIGVAALVVKDGRFHGCDIAGTKYSGTVAKDPETGDLTIEGEMDMPAGTYLVGGSSEMDVPQRRRLSCKLPPRFGELTAVRLPIPGVAFGIFKQHPDEFAVYADGMELRPKPAR